MKQILILLLSTVTVVLGKASLRVRFGIEGETYISLPITVDEAKNQSWVQEKRVDKVLPSLVLYCHSSFLICVFYDDTQYAAGLQIAIPEKDFKETVWDWNIQGYLKWTPSNGKSYWTKQQYFVNQEYLNTAAKQRVASRNPDTLLQVGGSVWVSGIRGELTELTFKPEPMISKLQFTEQGCFKGMGLHFGRLTSETKCDDEFFPWFILNNKNRELVGSGLGVGGKLDPAVLPKDWFERPPLKLVKINVPHAPQCLYDVTESPGWMVLHIYYVDEPWNITC